MPGCFAKPRNFGWSNDFCWPAVSTKERNTSPGHQSREHLWLSDDWGWWHHGHGTNTFILWAHITLWIFDEIEPITNNIMQPYQTIMLLNFNHLDIHNVLTWLTKKQLYTLDFRLFSRKNYGWWQPPASTYLHVKRHQHKSARHALKLRDARSKFCPHVMDLHRGYETNKVQLALGNHDESLFYILRRC